jgi:hypothetical protein
MADFSLEERFPDMKPISSAPSLGTVNGFGTMVYGARDYDPDTGTYVKTRCVTALFVPVCCLGAYRVADAISGGWYFLGKVPLSGLARAWNIMVVLLIVGGIGTGLWIKHTSSPEYIAQRKLAEGDRLADAGQLGEAARRYAQVARGSTGHAGAAVGKVEALLEGPAEGAAAEEVAAALGVAVELALERPGQLGGVYERGLALADKRGKDRPQDALRLLDAVAPLAPDPGKLAEKQVPLLEKVVAAEPDNLDHACRLAVAHEARGESDRCEKLLAPHRAKLGDTEGARVLGLIRFRQGKLDEARELLTAYTEARLEKRQVLAQNLLAAIRAVEAVALDDVQKRRAVGFDFPRFDQANNHDKNRMFNEYCDARLKEDEGVRQASAALARERHVTAAGLNLGMVLLQQADKLKGDERKVALEKAESTFLAVRGAAVQREEAEGANLKLAEVSYWLGKQAEGKKQFEQVLEDRAREPAVLLTVSQALRRVGELSEARRLAEEAHQRASTPEAKQQAALVRSLMAPDLDDRITWLKQTDVSRPELRADLNAALGQKAAADGDEEEAIRQLRAAVAEYDRLPPSQGSLNNGGIALGHLYRLTGDRADIVRARQKIERALALLPGDSILRMNAADFTLQGAALELLDGRLDLKVLRGRAGFQLLTYLYADPAGRDRLLAQVRAHRDFGQAVQHSEQLLILAPRKATTPALLTWLYALTRDVPGLRRLEERLQKADLDLERSTRETLENYQGKHLEKQRREHTARLSKYRKTLEGARKVGGATLAVAAADLAGELARADSLELPADLDEAVRLTEEADKAAPSRGTRMSLMAALLARAGRDLAKGDATYRTWRKRTRYALGHNYLIPLALTEGGQVGESAQANADVRRAAALARQDAQTFADEPGAWAWAMLRATHPEDAARLAKALAGNEAGRLTQTLGNKISPVTATGALVEAWALRAAGNEAEARAVLRRAAERGIPLPFDVK